MRLFISGISALLLNSLFFHVHAQSTPTNTAAMAAHFGHGTPALAPMTDLEGKTFSVEPLKGHWTLLYFWADWCMPCIEHGIPELSAFVQSSGADRSQYRVVGIRFNSTSEAGDWNDFKKKTELLEKTIWHGMPPFPLVYDSTTRVTTSWGVHALPTYALIDPKDNLVANEDLQTLKRALAKSH
jgi:thiol-disulfide isomerase/thioredoxin